MGDLRSLGVDRPRMTIREARCWDVLRVCRVSEAEKGNRTTKPNGTKRNAHRENGREVGREAAE